MFPPMLLQPHRQQFLTMPPPEAQRSSSMPEGQANWRKVRQFQLAHASSQRTSWKAPFWKAPLVRLMTWHLTHLTQFRRRPLGAVGSSWAQLAEPDTLVDHSWSSLIIVDLVRDSSHALTKDSCYAQEMPRCSPHLFDSLVFEELQQIRQHLMQRATSQLAQLAQQCSNAVLGDTMWYAWKYDDYDVQDQNSTKKCAGPVWKMRFPSKQTSVWSSEIIWLREICEIILLSLAGFPVMATTLLPLK